MIINFTSIIKSQGKENKIKFSAPVKISKYKNFKVYEFIEPSQNEMNRIEISKTKINIISGTSTIELELNKKIRILLNNHELDSINISSLMHSISASNENIYFNYSLFNNDNQIGNFDIAINFSK